jgi:transposase
MKSVKEFENIFLHREPVDMRLWRNGLCAIVEQEMREDLMASSLFVFINKKRNTLKILYFDQSGFAIWMKKLEKQKFQWPKNIHISTICLNPDQLLWLLEGFDILKMKPFEKLNYERVI